MPSFVYEKQLLRKGFKLIAGADEAGRGPLAGPIVAAAVILPADCSIKGLDDSKKLSPQKRERLFVQIKKKALAIGIGIINHVIIDRINIGQANSLAIKKAIENLKILPGFVLLDGSKLKIDSPVPLRGIAGGDAKCNSIAAASIIAKVTRDRLMKEYHKKYPFYGFARHKGYGTPQHLEALKEYGPCAIHRRSFSPVSALL